MLRRAIFPVCGFFLVAMNFSGCAGPDPILPVDIAKTIEENLGYALAPTWLPDDYEFRGIATDATVSDGAIVLPYSRQESYEYAYTIALMYPVDDDETHLLAMFPDLVKPDDAITHIKINGESAEIQHGTWTEETNRRIQHLETPLDPEWDYGRGKTVRFSVAVSEDEMVSAVVSSIFFACELTDDELVKIAESVTPVE